MPIYPPVGFHFKVQFDLTDLAQDEREGSFQEVSGINTELSVESFNEGGENRFSHRLPSRTSYGNLVLKRGMLPDTKLRQWFTDAVENMIIAPVEVRVMLLDPASAPVATWSFVNAYPVKWNVSGFNAQDGSLVIETIELTYQMFRRVA